MTGFYILYIIYSIKCLHTGRHTMTIRDHGNEAMCICGKEWNTFKVRLAWLEIEPFVGNYVHTTDKTCWLKYCILNWVHDSDDFMYFLSTKSIQALDIFFGLTTCKYNRTIFAKTSFANIWYGIIQDILLEKH